MKYYNILSEDEWNELQALAKDGWSVFDLQCRYGISKTAVNDIKRGKKFEWTAKDREIRTTVAKWVRNKGWKGTLPKEWLFDYMGFSFKMDCNPVEKWFVKALENNGAVEECGQYRLVGA